jgi:Holliday junction resolvase RusA-like endonuclease
MELEFKIKCNPPKQTAQSISRIFRRKDGTSFIGKKNNTSKGELFCLLKDYVPQAPFTGPLELTIDWCYAWRKSETKKNKSRGFMYCTTKPDIDNICKQLNDTMTRLCFWTDDATISRLVFTKVWCDEPCIKIKIKELDYEA